MLSGRIILSLISLLALSAAHAGPGPGESAPLDGRWTLTVRESVDGKMRDIKSDKQLSADLKVETVANHSAVVVTLANTSKRVARLEVDLGVTVAGAGLRWFDGRDYTEFGLDQLFYERTSLRLPLGAVHNDQAGYALALDPATPLTLFATAADYDGKNCRLGFRARVVLDPDQTLPLPLVGFEFLPQFGFRNALDEYYKLFPNEFIWRDGVSQNTIGNGGYLFSGRVSRVLQYEEARRFGMAWEWSYCPAQRPGDWYADERYWVDSIGSAGDTDSHLNFKPGTLEQYRIDMRERFHEGNKVTNLSYYLIPHAAEVEYMKDFSDGIIVDQNNQPEPVIPNWVKAGFDFRMVYPWGNSYAQETLEDIRLIVSDFDVRNFAFDEANRMDRHYGAGIAGDPGRAWDESGVYNSVQVALARQAGYIHDLTNSTGNHVGMVMNKPWTYNTAAQSDIAMHEWGANTLRDCMVSLRYLMGRKPISWWNGDEPEFLLAWERLSPEEIHFALQRIMAFLRLNSLHWGAYSANFSMAGFPELFQTTRDLTTMMRAGGWHVVPAMTAPENPKWYLSRYGQGLDTYLVIGNAAKESAAGPVTVYPGYFGASGVLLSCDAQGVTGQRIAADATVWQVALDAFGDRIYRSCGALELASGATATAEVTKTIGLEHIDLQIQLAVDGKATALTLALPEYDAQPELSLNGEAVAIGQVELAAGKLTLRRELGGKCEVRLRYLPPVSVLTAEETICKLPFTMDSAPNCRIVLFPKAVEADVTNAKRVQAFFDWYFRRQQLPSVHCLTLAEDPEVRGLVIPIVESKDAPEKGLQIVFVEAVRPQISYDAAADVLMIGGPDAAGREKALLRLLSLLEKEYPFYGGFYDKNPLYIKAGLGNRSLPDLAE